MRQPHRAGSAFTLLELLVVVLIVGILASLALPNYSRAVERAKVRDAQAVLAAIHSAERVYSLDQNSFGRVAPLNVAAADDLIRLGYLANPDAGGQSNPDWDFIATIDGGANFTATATRTQPGGGRNGQTVEIYQGFINNPDRPDFDGEHYGGTHELRDH